MAANHTRRLQTFLFVYCIHSLHCPCQRKRLTIFLTWSIIGVCRLPPHLDDIDAHLLCPQHVPHTLPGHMVTTGKRGHKTIYIPAESAGNVWKSIQIRAFNSFASERSRVRIPSGPPKHTGTNSFGLRTCSAWQENCRRGNCPLRQFSICRCSSLSAGAYR